MVSPHVLPFIWHYANIEIIWKSSVTAILVLWFKTFLYWKVSFFRLSTAFNVLEYRTVTNMRSNPPPRAFSSALYDNPSTLLGKTNGHLPQNINSLKMQSVSHEHSDSGLSAESQEYSLYSGTRLEQLNTVNSK